MFTNKSNVGILPEEMKKEEEQECHDSKATEVQLLSKWRYGDFNYPVLPAKVLAKIEDEKNQHTTLSCKSNTVKFYDMMKDYLNYHKALNSFRVLNNIEVSTIPNEDKVTLVLTQLNDTIIDNLCNNMGCIYVGTRHHGDTIPAKAYCEWLRFIDPLHSEERLRKDLTDFFRRNR